MSWTEQHWRAYVEPDWIRHGVSVHLGRTRDGVVCEVAQPVEIELVETEEAAQPGTNLVAVVNAPWLRLPDDVARALLDALALHYGGTSDLRQLRRDYDAERARVDLLIDRALPRKSGGGG